MSHTVDIETIVAGVDDSSCSHPALEWAAKEAALRQATLRIVYAATLPIGAWPVAPAPSGFMEWQAERSKDILDDACKRVQDVTHGSVRVDTVFAVATPAAVLVEESTTAGLVVVGSRGRGSLARHLLGSVSTALVHRAHCAVAVIHDDEPTPDQRAPVLLGYDGSPASDDAATLAFDEAARRNVELVVLHAWWSPGAFDMPGFDWEQMRPDVDREMAARLAPWQEHYPRVNVRRIVVADQPAHHLVELSATAQLVVVGSHGHGALAGTLLGSVSGTVVQSVRTPVVIYRPR
ncbi:universal stress protein [Mycolicibacterium fluoranthenivorans]|uniref:Universal stress protein n=1 Tax=Mycolicibacterium fluoranthenivorans TaxID=258505 RepID=A0A7G8P999_9MYCO|nr:universal stress protein [Mycolicibacterium fluoranthenivorans]QNJ90915.1 universal stress protein [Mycolicibacterium fluoranthenivorans]